MDSRVENSERSLPERRKGYQIRLDEIKQLWKRRKGDYLRRRSRRDHAPTRRRRTPTIHTEDEKDLEAEWETLTAHGSFEVKPENREVLPTTEEGEEPPLEPETLGKEGESVSEAVVETENGVRCDRSSVLSQSTELAAERMAARRGCRPPMDLFRSETMRLFQFIIPMDSAHRTVSYLGDLGLLQFKDLKAEKKRSMEGLQATPSPPPEPPDTISLSTTFPRPLPPPKPPDRGMLVVEVGIFHDLGEMLLFPATEECGRDERAKEIRAVGLLMFSGHTADPMGLGRTSSFNSTPFINEGRLSKEETKMGLVIYGPHPMSQTELETVGGNSLAFTTRPYGNKDEEPKNEGKHNMQRYYIGSASVKIVQRWSSWLVKRNMGSPTETTVGTWKCALIMFDKITVCEIRERIVEFTGSSSFGNCPDFFYYFGHLHVPIPLILETMIQDQIRNIGNGNNLGEDESRLVMWSLIQLAVAVLPVAIACKGLQIIVEIDEQERHYDGSSYGKFGVMMPKSQAGLFSSYLIVPKVSDHEKWDPVGSTLGTWVGANCIQEVEKKSWAKVTAIWHMRLIGGVSDPSLNLPLDFAICGTEAAAASKISIQECPRLIDNGFSGGLHIDELTLKIYKQEEHPCNREVVGLLLFQQWDPGGSKVSRWKCETFHVAAREIQFSVRSFRLWDPGGLCWLFICHLEDKVNL